MAEREPGHSRQARRGELAGPRSRDRVRRPRYPADGDLGFSRTFRIAFETLGARAAQLVLVPIVLLLVLSVGLGVMIVLLMTAAGQAGGIGAGAIAIALYVFLFSFLFGFMTDVAHAHLAGSRTTWSDSLGKGVSRSPSVAFILVAVGAAVVVMAVAIGVASLAGPVGMAVMALITVVVVLCVRIGLWTAIPICIAEGTSGFEAITRSVALVRANLSRVVPIALATLAISIVANVVLQAALSSVDSVFASLFAMVAGLFVMAFELCVATATHHILSGQDGAGHVDERIFA